MMRRRLLTGSAALAAFASLPRMARSQAVPAPAPRPIGPAKFGSVQTRLPFLGAATPTGAGYSIESVLTAESDFDWVRFFYLNYSTSAAFTVNSAAVAASSSLNDGVNPTNAAGTADNTLWVPVTFNNAGAPGDIPSPAGSTRSVVVPAAVQGTLNGSANDRVPGLALSDWVPVQWQPRLDTGVGTLPLVFCRTYSANGMYALNPALLYTGTVGGSTWDQYAQGRIVRTFANNGDTATAPGTIAVATNSVLLPSGVQFLSRKRGLSVMAVGDSLYQGFGTTSQENSPFHIACTALSTPAFPITFANAGYQGSSTATFQANAYAFTAAFNPDVAVLKAESVNDSGYGAATMENSLARAMAFCDWCTRRNIVPVISTAEPWQFSVGSATELARSAFNAAIRQSGWAYVDYDLALRDPANPQNILPAYNSSVSPPHYNDAGSAAVAAFVKPILQKIMAARPR